MSNNQLICRMKIAGSRYLIVVVGIFLNACSYNVKVENPVVTSPKNVILMIGDGMGVAQVYSALTAQHGNLAMNRCESFGFVKTQSADNYITDSAAGATALATGKKVNNDVIGISPIGDTLVTLLELAEKKGLGTGMVVTSSIIHATPAGFIAHTSNRYNYEEIAENFLKTDIDVFIGGGRDYFEERTDGKNLSDILRRRNYNVVYDVDGLNEIKQGKLAGLLSGNHMPKISEGRGDYLKVSSLKAIELLDVFDNGFFLMVEGSQIDFGGHENDSEYLVSETVDFDRVVGEVLDFAAIDGETLVLITADHETGGYSLPGGDIISGEVSGKFSTDEHTGVMVPLFAFGPGSDKFKGIIDNTEVFQKIVELLNLVDKKQK